MKLTWLATGLYIPSGNQTWRWKSMKHPRFQSWRNYNVKGLQDDFPVWSEASHVYTFIDGFPYNLIRDWQFHWHIYKEARIFCVSRDPSLSVRHAAQRWSRWSQCQPLPVIRARGKFLRSGHRAKAQVRPSLSVLRWSQKVKEAGLILSFRSASVNFTRAKPLVNKSASCSPETVYLSPRFRSLIVSEIAAIDNLCVRFMDFNLAL